MPPKLTRKDKPEVTILKFKRLKTTYALPVSGNFDLEDLKDKLVSAINGSGGLSLTDSDDVKEEDVFVPDSELIDEDDIPVPKSEFIDQDEPQTETSNSNTAEVDTASIRLAIPKDKTQPYENQWIQLSEGVLEDLKFGDYDILAFAFEQEDFYITEAIYED